MNEALIKTLTAEELEVLGLDSLNRSELLAVIDQYRKLIDIVLQNLNN